MTMENMGELPADQQINGGDSSNGAASQGQPSPQDPDYGNSQEELETNITRSDAIPVSVSSMIDSSEFRSQMGDVTYHTLNDRMSPSYSPNNSYATLTPLQPLPPISTVSDKFSHVGPNVSGSFTLMPQNNGLGAGIMDMTTYGQRYDKLGMAGVSMNVGPTLGATAMTMMSQQNLNYHQVQGLGSYGYGVAHTHNGLASPKSEPKMNSPNSYVDTYAASPIQHSAVSVRLHSPNSMMMMNGLNNAPTPSPHGELSPQRERPGTSMDLKVNGQQQEIEEINTKELAQRISSELKRYSIPQAVFAQRVLCRSQGTLSDLLRNPKPWSKLKSGRETFRRMWKWLQEPEFQRMSALRLAGSLSSVTRPNNNMCSPMPVDENQDNKDTIFDRYGTDSWFGVGEPFRPQQIMHDANFASPRISAGNEPFRPQQIMHDANFVTPRISSGNGSAFKPQNSPKPAFVQQGYITDACKRKEMDIDNKSPEENRPPKKPRLVFTDIQRRTLHAIFKETKRPSKEMQQTIAQQLGLEVTTVANFFMNARRRSLDKWQDDTTGISNRETMPMKQC